MDTPWKPAFRKLVDEAGTLKQEALNRHDPAFDPWHRRARSVLLRYAPVKIPAFDEIRFASDFFLSKPAEEQTEINDRIALACDLDLAVELFQQAEALVDEEWRFQKSRERFRTVTPVVQGGGPAPAASPPPAPASTGGLEALMDWVRTLDLREEEIQQAVEELERARRALASRPPDWDRLKRTLKFLLDFDQTLARKAVPLLLLEFEQQTNS